MNNLNVIESVNRQNKIIHYVLWVVTIILAIMAAGFFVRILNEQVWQTVPSGYKFAVSDHSTKDVGKWTTYYVYDHQIIVYKEFPDKDSNTSPATIYDNVDTSSLILEEDNLAKSCDADACYNYPKVVDDIKTLIANKINREFLRP